MNFGFWESFVLNPIIPRTPIAPNLSQPSTEKFRNCLVMWEIMFIFAGSKMSFCRKTTYIITTANGAKCLVLMGLRLRRRRVLIWVQVSWRCLGMNQKTVFRVGKRGGYLDTKGRSFCLSVVKDGGIEAKIWVEAVKTGVNRWAKTIFIN